MSETPQAELKQTVLAYLRDHNTLTLATTGPDGPWAAAVFYVNDGFDLYFLSEPDTRHSRNVAANPQVSATIHEDYTNWRLIQGIQLEGRCEMIGAPAKGLRAMRLYIEKYPFIDSLAAAPELARALAKTRFYRIRPTRLYFIDNTQGFSHREEVDPSALTPRPQVHASSGIQSSK